MELKRYKNIVLFLLIILLASLLYYINLAQFSSSSRAAPLSENISIIDIGEQYKGLEKQNDSAEDYQLDINRPLTELQRYSIPENYQQLLVEKNIFNLIKKEELTVREVEELPVREPETGDNDDYPVQVEPIQAIEERVPEVPNPFYLHAVSINFFDQRAIIVNSNNSMTYLIKPGDIVDGYLVKEIDFQQVIMEKEGQEIVVVFRN